MGDGGRNYWITCLPNPYFRVAPFLSILILGFHRNVFCQERASPLKNQHFKSLKPLKTIVLVQFPLHEVIEAYIF